MQVGGSIKAPPEAEHTEGAWELSLMHAHGKTGVVDKEEARKWLKIAAEGGAVKAQMFLAQMSTFGRGGYEKDESVAFEYLERAADQGNARDAPAGRAVPLRRRRRAGFR